MHLGVPRRLNKPLAGLRQPPCYESMAAMESAELIVSDKARMKTTPHVGAQQAYQ